MAVVGLRSHSLELCLDHETHRWFFGHDWKPSESFRGGTPQFSVWRFLCRRCFAWAEEPALPADARPRRWETGT